MTVQLLASARGKLFYTTEDGRVVFQGGK